MSALVVVAVGLGGVAGALLRAFVGRWIRYGFPLATLSVNITGSFLMGASYAWLPAASELARALIGTGFCGALTTFSTFMLECVILARSGQPRRAALYLILTLGLCCLASWGGFLLMS